jgi:predicted naringenin-chalcone synthase
MPVYIHDIVSSVPVTSYEQDFIREKMKDYLGKDRRTQAIIHRIYSQSGIRKRHTVVDDFESEPSGPLFFNGRSELQQPGTAQRNELYKEHAIPLFRETAEKLLHRNKHITKDDITHVITVSCTGFFAPGPEYEIVRHLGLKPSTQRYHLGFMGCFAAFPAMKMASAFCKDDPDAVVLIVCTELCSLHLQSKTEVDNLISASVFADGSAGLLMSSKKPENHGFEIIDFASSLTNEGERDMAWIIGDTGFDMTLSTYVPDIINKNLKAVIQPLLDEYGINADDIDYWALHPGGRAIIDKIEQSLELNQEQISASRTVLAEFGNMSSATVLFVLQNLLEKPLSSGSKLIPMAFGPGLTIETALLKHI